MSMRWVGVLVPTQTYTVDASSKHLRRASVSEMAPSKMRTAKFEFLFCSIVGNFSRSLAFDRTMTCNVNCRLVSLNLRRDRTMAEPNPPVAPRTA